MTQETSLERAGKTIRRRSIAGAALAILALAAIVLPMKASAQHLPPVNPGPTPFPSPSPSPPPGGGGGPGGGGPPGGSNPPGNMLNLAGGSADVSTGNIEFHLQSIRDGEEPPMPEPEPAPGGKEVIEPKDYSKEPKTVVPLEEQNRWDFFAFGSGQFADLRSTAEHPGFASTTAGVTLGLDYHVTDHLVLGITAGYAGTYASMPFSGSTSIDSGRGGLFGTWFDGPWYVDGVAQGAYDAYDYWAGSGDGSIHGNTSGGEFDSFLKGGYDVVKTSVWSIGPTLGLRYTYLGADGFTANGDSGQWTINSSDANSLRTIVGARAVAHFRIGNVTLRPSVEVGWQHQFLDTIYTAGFHAPDGSLFNSSTNAVGRDGVYVTAGVLAQIFPRVAVFVNYIGDLARTNYDSNTVTGGFSISF
jgi:uncharacterized protein YhjY with autotransporter beta-barrel domain